MPLRRLFIDSHAQQQGILHANGGGGWSTIVVRGGEVTSNLLSTFLGVKAASDVELQPICFFDSEKNGREPDLWTP